MVQSRVFRMGLFVGCGILLVLHLGGCGSEPELNAPSKPVSNEQTQPEKRLNPKKPDFKVIWASQVKKTRQLIADDQLDEARGSLQEFEKIYVDPEQPSEKQQQQLADLEKRLKEKVRGFANQTRKDRLANAVELVNAGQYEEATRALNDVLKSAPTDEQRQTAETIAQDIEKRRQTKRRLGALLQMLASSNRREVQSAQSQLSRQAEIALPILLELLQKSDKPALVSNTLELMRRMKRPDVVLPAMVGVLKRVEQEQNWPDVVREIPRVARPGAGPLLLELALNSGNSKQRIAALETLAVVVDPPEKTLIAMLPLIGRDAPELPAALQVVLHAVQTHQQYDLVARRGLDMKISAEQQKQLDKLPQRLAAIQSSKSKPEQGKQNAAYLAKLLAMTLRYLSPAPFSGVKIARVSAEEKDGPVAMVLDGKWNQTELETMWRHPVNLRSSLILDLGEVKTVTGVQIWNFNQPGGMHRGWKDVEIFVSESTSSLRPVAVGIVPMAPGIADTPDYSTIISVPFVRGRYVRLEGKSAWRPDVYTGLSEVQIIGF